MTVMENEDPARPEAEIDECEAVIACLGDDAALLRRENPDCEIAANMDAAADMLEELRAENSAIKETLHDELDGNLRLRVLGGARPDECMTTFVERVFAERELYAELLRHALDALEYHREQTRPIARNDSVIERLREQLGA